MTRRLVTPVVALLAGAALAAAVAAVYVTLLRSRCLTWGSSPEDVSRKMPGDDLLAAPDLVSTRSVTIDAPPKAVWPWLVQMGSGRGGVYTYDWIENLLGLNMHSVDRIVPEFQDRSVGDVEQLGSKGPTLRVEIMDEERAMVLRSVDGNWVWAFGLYPTADGGTVLVSRNRIVAPSAAGLTRAFNTVVMEPGSLVMERKMLLGIKARAETLAAA